MTVRNHLITDKCDARSMTYLDGCPEFHVIEQTRNALILKLWPNTEKLIIIFMFMVDSQ